jgi:hypothetical protein
VSQTRRLAAILAADVQHDVVDPVRFDHCSALPLGKNARNPAQLPLRVVRQ